MHDAALRGFVRCGVAALLFGSATPLAARIASDSAPPALAGLLYLGAALGVAAFVRLPRRADLRRERRRLGVAVLAGGFVAPLLLVAGLARSDGATGSLLLNLELVATVLLAGLFFREHLGRRVVVGGALVAAAGVVSAWSTTPQFRVGALLIAGACLCWGLDNCATANIAGLAPEVITFAKGAIAGSANLAIAAATGASFPTSANTALALGVGAVGYGLSITLWIRGARDIGAARGQLVFAVAPFAGVLVAWGVLREDVRTAQVVALGLAAAGVSFVLRSDHEHAHTHSAVTHAHEHSHDDDHHDHPHETAVATHEHEHSHPALVHAHPHLPDLHHRHQHHG